VNQCLAVLIEDYLSSVVSAVRLLEESGFPRPSSNHEFLQSGVNSVREFRESAEIKFRTQVAERSARC
jgi:hypothetical protein